MLFSGNTCHNLWPLYTPSMLKRNESPTMSILDKAFDLFLLLTGAVAIVSFTI